MHELGIAQSALRHVLEHASRLECDQVVGLTVRIGAVSGVDPDAFRAAFAVLVPGTAAASARLNIEMVPVAAHCAHCAADFPAMPDFVCECPRCGQLSADIVAGRELELRTIELAPLVSTA